MKNYVNPLVREKLKSLHPGKEEEKLVREYYKKKIKLSLLAAGAGLLLGIASFIGGNGNKAFPDGGEIPREEQDGNVLEIPAVAHSEKFGNVDVDIVVDRRVYTGEEREKAFDETEKWLEQVMPGNNEGLSCVREDLVFPDYYEECGIDIRYSSDHYDLVDESGRVRNEELDIEKNVLIRAELSYGDFSRSCTYEVTVCPPLLTEVEKFQKIWSRHCLPKMKGRRKKRPFGCPVM